MKKQSVIIFMLFMGICVAQSDTKLKTYRTRRDTTKSGEPRGAVKKRTKGKPIFVIQKHDASHLHYDVRLEIDGVLVSWAVPKGPSLNPSQRRLAMRTDDHPLDYADFEGVIPEGHYGAGTVMVWDYGTFTNIKREKEKLIPVSDCLDMGTIEVELHGKKLQGKFALIKTGKKSDKKWLLIKMKDEYASSKRNPVSTQNKSARTGRTMHQITKQES
jgi:DNA ligase D-like protein (predicted 3'-phosphoesterase)